MCKLSMFTFRFLNLKYELPKPELIRKSFSSQKVYSHKQYMFFEVKLLRACKHKAIDFAAGSKNGGGRRESMFCPRSLVMGEKQKSL